MRRRLLEKWPRYLLMTLAFVFLFLFLLLPLCVVFFFAFKDGVQAFVAALSDPDALDAIKLTGWVVAFTLPINVVFGLAAAWLVTKFRFRGRALLMALIDLPFSVSPVIAGVLFVLAFGVNSFFGEWLLNHGIQVIFAPLGIMLATLFVTFPFVARELIPLMQGQGTDQESAALTLGAGGFQTFFKVTLPNIRWGLLYGMILATARAIGEFGAVSVVSGHIRGLTNTMSLHVEVLYNDYQFSAAFAVASLMVIITLCVILLKSILTIKLYEGKR